MSPTSAGWKFVKWPTLFVVCVALAWAVLAAVRPAWDRAAAIRHLSELHAVTSSREIDRKWLGIRWTISEPDTIDFVDRSITEEDIDAVAALRLPPSVYLTRCQLSERQLVRLLSTGVVRCSFNQGSVDPTPGESLVIDTTCLDLYFNAVRIQPEVLCRVLNSHDLQVFGFHNGTITAEISRAIQAQPQIRRVDLRGSERSHEAVEILDQCSNVFVWRDE